MSLGSARIFELSSSSFSCHFYVNIRQDDANYLTHRDTSSFFSRPWKFSLPRLHADENRGYQSDDRCWIGEGEFWSEKESSIRDAHLCALQFFKLSRGTLKRGPHACKEHQNTSVQKLHNIWVKRRRSILRFPQGVKIACVSYYSDPTMNGLT